MTCAIVLEPTLSRTVTVALASSVTIVCTRQPSDRSGFRRTVAGALITAFERRGSTVIVVGDELVVLPSASLADTMTEYTPGAAKTCVTVVPCAPPSPKLQTGSVTVEPWGSTAATENVTCVPTVRSRGIVRFWSVGPVTSIVTETGVDGGPTLPARSTARTV